MTGMAVNKVIYGGSTLIDLSGDTVSADKLLAGYTAHAADGERIIGTMQAAVDTRSCFMASDGSRMMDANGGYLKVQGGA